MREGSESANDTRRLDGLSAVFPGREVFVVADDEEIGRAAADYGLAFVPLEDAEKLPAEAAVVLFLRHSMVSREIRKKFRKAGVLVVPIASFDASLEAALYTMKMTLLTDYKAAAEFGRYWADSLSNQPGPLMFHGNGGSGNGERTDLTCRLADDLSVDAWLTPQIETGQWISVGAYCELSLTAPSTSNWQGAFTIDGRAVVSGVLVARDARYTEVGDARIREAAKVRDELVGNAPIIVDFEGGAAVSIRAGGQDYTDAVREVTNPDYDLNTLELGLGTNMSLLPRVDWWFNSQLNEGAGPVHLGFGEGMTGAHMDFVVAEGAHEWAPTPAE